MNNQGIRNAWEEIHNQPYRAPEKVPDRVIDASIWEKRKELSARLYEEWCQLSIYERGKFTDYVFDYCARLEAEKQDARRIGLEFALHLATEIADWCIEEQEKGYLGAMRVADAIKRELSKPTAAKQGDPS